MEILDDVLVPMELKYYERCGGLWFRAKDEQEVYCPGCVPQIAELPKPRRKRVVVVAVSSVDEIEGCLAASVDWIDDEWDSGRNPDLWLYRKRTEKILRKYFRMSVEVGRLPSILGSEFFRTHVTSYSVSSFEDAVIFVHDVERCVSKLDRLSQEVIARVILQGFSHEEAGRRCWDALGVRWNGIFQMGWTG